MTFDRTAAPGGNPVVPGSGQTANTQPAARSDVPLKWDDRTQLDAPSKRELEDGRPFTLRYALLHLIEETSGHNGHLDILRELADGVTGP
jgi:hypothetical protein